MSISYLSGEVKKCEACGGRGYTISENHPDCPTCSGNGYLIIDDNSEDN